MSFDEFVLRKQYGKVRGLGDRLALMKDQIEWGQVGIVDAGSGDGEN